MKQIILLISLLTSYTLNAQINKIEHFYASSPNAEKLFNLFKTEFGLPVVWDYQTWGSFSSGGITLGNVAFEFVTYENVSKTLFEGIALEPRQPVEEFIQVLDEVKLMHDSIEPNTFIMPNGVVAGWSTLTLKNLLPDEAGLFICDYKNREKVLQNRENSADTLKQNNGGPLGIISLEEIVIGSANFLFHKNELAKLPGIKINQDDVFSFEQGPSLRLVNSAINSIQKIVIKVHSVKTAEHYLRSRGFSDKLTRHSVFLKTGITEGLIIELTDK